ncbi:MAG: FkbM family methyltransferase [Rubripirellula sp.]|nr:FkbM family methyltransferase [Rubripirellula sp.]
MIIDLQKMVAEYALPIRAVLHVGAHHGQEDELYQQLGVRPIYVEANPEVFTVLTENLPERECFNVAISDHIGTTEFHVTSFDQSSSILPLKKHKEIYPDIVEKKLIQVPCTTIDELTKDLDVPIDLLNMDIQGAELMALHGATRTLGDVKCIMTEVNRAELYEGCGMIGDLDQFLNPFGFRRVVSDFKYHKSWGDAFYVRSEFVKSRSILGTMKKVLGLERHSA